LFVVGVCGCGTCGGCVSRGHSCGGWSVFVSFERSGFVGAVRRVQVHGMLSSVWFPFLVFRRPLFLVASRGLLLNPFDANIDKTTETLQVRWNLNITPKLPLCFLARC
jgi:hypothetical protein